MDAAVALRTGVDSKHLFLSRDWQVLYGSTGAIWERNSQHLPRVVLVDPGVIAQKLVANVVPVTLVWFQGAASSNQKTPPTR